MIVLTEGTYKFAELPREFGIATGETVRFTDNPKFMMVVSGLEFAEVWGPEVLLTGTEGTTYRLAE